MSTVADTAVDVDVEALLELARCARRKIVEDNDRPARAHGTTRQKGVWMSGYLAGVCAAIAVLTVEPAAEIEARIVVEVDEE